MEQVPEAWVSGLRTVMGKHGFSPISDKFLAHLMIFQGGVCHFEKIIK